MSELIPKIPVVKTTGPFVALLLEDVAESARVAKAFRQLGILPQVFSSLDEFWDATSKERPLCALVDIKIMNSRDKLIIDHPGVKNKTLPLVLFVRESTRTLLQATFPVFHTGVVLQEESQAFGEEAPYLGQIRSNLQRIDFFNGLQIQAKELGLEFSREKHKTKMLVASTQKLRESRDVQSQIAEALESLTKDLPAFGLWESVSRLFERWDWIKAYGILEISSNSRQLISPGLQKSKYHRLPAVWLGKENRDGVAYFSQSMAYQVAQEIMGENLRPLMIASPGKAAEALIFLKVDEDMVGPFDWEYFKSLLGLFLIRQQQVDVQLQEKLRSLAPWEFLTRLDQEYAENLESSAQLYQVDLSAFADFIRSRHKEVFFWKDFHHDLTIGLSRLLPEKSVMSWMKWDRLMIFVPVASKNDLHQDLKNYFERFPYWRFCQDEDLLFTQIFKTEVRMIPISAKAVISSLYAPAPKNTTDNENNRKSPNASIWTGPAARPVYEV